MTQTPKKLDEALIDANDLLEMSNAELLFYAWKIKVDKEI